MTAMELPDLLDETVAFVRRHIVFDAVHADTVALWNAHTYVYDCAAASPYLHPHSPEPGSGKTTLLDVLEVIACNADPGRQPHRGRAVPDDRQAAPDTVVRRGRRRLRQEEQRLDRRHPAGAEQRLPEAARRRTGVSPPSHEVVAFDVYCPKATAGLNQLPGTLAHRSIPIAMKPPRPDDDYEDFDYEEALDDAEQPADQPAVMGRRGRGVLRDPRLKPAKLPGLDARGNEIWRILFRIADHGGRRLARTCAHRRGRTVVHGQPARRRVDGRAAPRPHPRTLRRRADDVQFARRAAEPTTSFPTAAGTRGRASRPASSGRSSRPTRSSRRRSGSTDERRRTATSATSSRTPGAATSPRTAIQTVTP